MNSQKSIWLLEMRSRKRSNGKWSPWVTVYQGICKDFPEREIFRDVYIERRAVEYRRVEPEEPNG